MYEEETVELWERRETQRRFYFRNVKKREQFEDLDVYRRIILKWVLKNRMRWHRLD
jgi:hypothetical protein